MIDDENLRTRILEKLIAEGTGATGSYPTPLNELPKLREVLADGTKYRCAKNISKSIVTLPVHSGVSAADRENIKRIIKAVSHAN
jgi:dTDP-4-amino-4,6-dideoxygalactose transaminase